MDYIVDDVRQRQPADVRTFLLQTSVLGRLSAVVTGQGNGKAALATLERSNLFVVPLDEVRQWYRYHHLICRRLNARIFWRSSGMRSLLGTGGRACGSSTTASYPSAAPPAAPSTRNWWSTIRPHEEAVRLICIDCLHLSVPGRSAASVVVQAVGDEFADPSDAI
jgi:hypothetical protein